MKITTDKVIENYIERRNSIKELEDRISELKALQQKCEQWLLTKLDEDGETSKKTAHGTVYVKVSESVTVADQDMFLNWVKENDAWECIEKRAAKTAILQIMGDREEGGRPNPTPPGLNYVAVRNVGIRRG